MNRFKGLFDTNPEIFIAGTCISFGALAHAFDEIRKKGWKGWFSFISDMVICAFAGFIFFQIAQVTYPQYTFLYCSLGSFWGTKGFKYIYEWFVESLRVIVDKNNE
jgi:hypothetical protein